MAYFNYRAIDQTSNIVSGRMEAIDEDDLVDKLTSQGLVLIETTKLFTFPWKKKGFTDNDLLNFTYFFRLIISSGMPIVSGLNDMARQASNKRLANAASQILARLESGKSISDSMIESPEIFPVFYTSMIKAGEISGNLEKVLADLMAYIEWKIKLKKDIRTALAYPATILGAVVIFTAVLFTFVIPKFIKILTDMKVALPLPTKLLMCAVGIIKGYWPVIGLVLISLPLIFRFVYNTDKGRRFIDSIIIKIPLFGGLIVKLNHSRYFRTFSVLYGAGLNMTDTLMAAAEVVNNTSISEIFKRVSERVIEGEQLSTALEDTGQFPHLILNMIEIGEKTGTLDVNVQKISDLYDREIPETLKKIFMIVEPLLIFLLGALVLFTLASFFLPLYKLTGGLRR